MLVGALFLVITGIVVHRIGKGELNLNDDEPFHACTGMYVADFLRALPLAHPLRFTFAYYARYPAIALIHWPPFFYLAEGFAFLIGGVSVIAARTIVLVFALLGLYFWFKLTEEFEDSYYAFASTILVALSPSVLLYEKAVMLEVPSLALYIAASYYWIRYLRRGASRDVYLFVSMAILALLTKQTTICLLAFCLLTLVSEKKWSLLSKAATWKAFFLSVLLVGPFYYMAFRTHWKVIQYDVLKTKMPGNPLLAYFRMLPMEFGLPILCLSVLGMATSPWWGKNEHTRIMLMWIASCYLVLTGLAQKEPRYSIYWTPPFIYFATGPLISKRLSPGLRQVGTAVILVLMGSSIWTSWNYQRPYICGYAEMAKDVTQRSKSGILLFDGDMASNFIFHVRQFDPGGRFVVLRKALYAIRENIEWGYIEFVKNNQELEHVIDQYGIRFVIVDNGPTRFQSQELLRQYLRSPRFKLVRTVQTETNLPSWKGRKLFLYENVQPTPCSAKVLHIEMLSWAHAIEVSPSELGIDCTSKAASVH